MSTNRPPLWKQVIGAVAGAGLALVLYSGYQEVVPQIQAYIQLQDWQLKPEGQAHVRPAAKGISEEDYLRLEQRTREIMEDLGAKDVVADPEPMDHYAEEMEERIVDRIEKRLEQPAEGVSPLPAHLPTPGGQTPTTPHAIQGDPTPALPDSGVGILGAALLAGAGAGVMRMRK